ncbi:EKC/KEOPS complex subunit Bud32p [Trichomonascus vanleenenianus]|uniref:serine/threonine protein kinase BUD32 n=1 Tax=Trichomonascus vanleenenianus TaxID=2268995 RepID=UPI003ECB74CD
MIERLENKLKEITKSIELVPVSQGAEALVYSTKTHPYLDNYQGGLIIKYRPPKPYRHQVLDAQLTKHRTLSEARILQKLNHIGTVNAPKLVFVDPRNGVIWMEQVQGVSLKQWIWDSEEKVSAEEIRAKLELVGREIGSLHLHGLIHGDLTTSNIMLDSTHIPYIIDFGLASHADMPEDKAVDIYVMERAVTSTHPVHSEEYNRWLLEGYTSAHKHKKDKIKLQEVLKRLEEVRMRGRKRSMVG